MRLLILFILFASCVTPQLTPSCECIKTANLSGEKLSIQIESNSDFLIIHREGVAPTKIIRHYYNCVTIRADKGDLLKIEDDRGKLCDLKVN